MTWPGIEPKFPGSMANTLPTRFYMNSWNQCWIPKINEVFCLIFCLQYLTVSGDEVLVQEESEKCGIILRSILNFLTETEKEKKEDQGR